ncbi:MAG: AI-2E family transporter [Beijerinckiaceae bacterium]|nr:AI-2E family transporter [Beijerinckiaceae bacterium]
MTAPLTPAPPPAAQSQKSQTSPAVVAAQTPQRDMLTMLAVGVVVVTALYVGRDIILPVVLAVILAFVLTPIVNFLRRLRIPRAPAVILSVAFALAMLTTLGFLITSQVGQLAADLPRYEATIQQKVSGIQEGVIGRISNMADNLGRRFERTAETETSPSETARAEQARPMPVELHMPDLTPLQLAQRFILPALHPLATFAITFVVLIFIMLQREDLRDRVIRLFGSRDLHRTTIAMDDAAIRLSRYFLMQVALSAMYGVLASFFLWIIGVPSPILCGVLAAAMRFVPYVGSIIAAVFPMALAMAVDPGWTTLLLTIAFFTIGESSMGYVVEPLVYGQSTGLSPFAVILSTIFWSWLWGPVGLILAMPLTLCLVVLGRHVESFQFLDVILGDSPPLEPSQNFYQRMLAEDPDEALEQAEIYLKERSLIHYYDDVALPGLILAARDAGRGVLKSENLDSIRRSVHALATDLSGTPDLAPPQADEDPAANTAETDAAALDEVWRTEGAVLCVAGRGPLDEAASTLLVDVLRKHGFGALLVPYASVTRGRAGTIDASHAKLACVTHLELEGAPAHLRYLLRRLRNALPPVTVVAGLWPSGDPIQSDDALRAHVGADHYVTTVREALEVVLTEAHAPPEVTEKRAEAAARLDRPLPLP